MDSSGSCGNPMTDPLVHLYNRFALRVNDRQFLKSMIRVSAARKHM